MGRHIDSVVVDSERTARDAIQYLKDNQVPPMTFIPLATCKVNLRHTRTHTHTHTRTRTHPVRVDWHLVLYLDRSKQ